MNLQVFNGAPNSDYFRFFYVLLLILSNGIIYIQIFVRNTFTNENMKCEFTIHIINSPFLSDNELKYAYFDFN